MIVWTGITKFVPVLYSFATYNDIACIAHAEMQLHSRRMLIQYYQTQTSRLSCWITSCAVDISSHVVRQIAWWNCGWFGQSANYSSHESPAWVSREPFVEVFRIARMGAMRRFCGVFGCRKESKVRTTTHKGYKDHPFVILSIIGLMPDSLYLSASTYS